MAEKPTAHNHALEIASDTRLTSVGQNRQNTNKRKATSHDAAAVTATIQTDFQPKVSMVVSTPTATAPIASTNLTTPGSTAASTVDKAQPAQTSTSTTSTADTQSNQAQKQSPTASVSPQDEYLESMRQFTNFGAGQLNTQESQLVSNMMMMNPYVWLQLFSTDLTLFAFAYMHE